MNFEKLLERASNGALDAVILILVPHFGTWHDACLTRIQPGIMIDAKLEFREREPFQTTHWSVVIAAGNGSSDAAARASAELCRIYWFPLYAFVRRQGNSPEDAEDLTQEFFARFLEKGSFGRADRERGRFRTFLLTSMKRFQTEEWRRANRLKRGGGVTFISDGVAQAESIYSTECRTELSPDRLFERRWAEALLDRTLNRLRTDYQSTGRSSIYTQLEVFLWGRKAELSYTEMAAGLGLTEGAVKVAVHRLRQRFRELLREEVAQTVDGAEQVDDEMRYLIEVFAK